MSGGSTTPMTLPVRRLIGILPPEERRAFYVAVVVMFFGAVFETAGVASILPFMAAVMDPGVIGRSRILTSLVERAGATTPTEALTVVAALVIATLVIGNAASMAAHLVHQRFLERVRRKLASELFSGYLAQPYSFHVKHDAASLNKVLSNDVEAVVGGALSPLLVAASRGSAAVGLLALVLVRDPVMAIGTAVVLGGAYFAIYRAVRAPQARLGEELSIASVDRWRTTIEGFGGIKELIVLGRQGPTTARFDRITTRLMQALRVNTLTSLLPRYILETIAFGGIILVTLALVIREGGAEGAIPTLALYAFVGYRLMPALQQVFAAGVTTQLAVASFGALERDLAFVRAARRNGVAVEKTVPALGPERELRFDRVSFSYEGANRPALRDVSLVVGRNQSVGLVGRTGAGKTTLADLLLGLYQPTSGVVSVGGTVLDSSTVRSWQQRVGYVPQFVFLANASVARNIAFGLDDADIDRAAVERAARMAQAEEFISALPQGLDTIVGERGVKLSGGQRQRLGIARALYHSPDVLVFDEATSSLDGMTEEAVMDAIRSLSGDRTVILIAHRLRTVEACDRIILMEDGRVVADGAYHELLERSPEFRQLVGRGRNMPQASGA